MKVYAKNSFDRFGDDLTKVILQYLTLEDKIRLECVSKQWQRSVFEKQSVIRITYNKFFVGKDSLNRVLVKITTDGRRQVNEQRLESVLKKCPNIKRVYLCFAINTSVLSLIGRYCHHIKTLTYEYSNEDNALDFFRNNGHKLEKLSLYHRGEENETVKSYLELCPNLKTIYIPKRSIQFFDDKEFLPKLKAIYWLSILSQNLNQMKILSDKYSQTMKTLDVILSDLAAEELKTSIECIARFENLKDLSLQIRYFQTQPIDDCLSLIGQNCTKLLRFQFINYSSTSKSDQFFNAITEFKAIKVLRISLPYDTVLFIECFKHCKQLYELDISYPELREDFFANIDLFVPKLQLLKIGSNKQFSDLFILPFQSMKRIQKIEFRRYNKANKIIDNKTWCFGKSLIEVMLSPNGMNVKHITHNCDSITFPKSYFK